MANVDKDIEFLKEMKVLSNSLLKNAYDVTKLQSLDSMIDDWLNDLSDGKKTTSELNTKALPLHGVVQQRELLIAFVKYTDAKFMEDDTRDALMYVNRFLESNL